MEKGNTSTIEYAVWKATVSNKTIHSIAIYHQPTSSTNKTTTGMFIDQMTYLQTDNLDIQIK